MATKAFEQDPGHADFSSFHLLGWLGFRRSGGGFLKGPPGQWFGWYPQVKEML